MTDTTKSQTRAGVARGFTLIELLVVIAIIAILAALLLPALAAAKRKTKLAACQNDFHQTYAACYIYATDYNDYFPIDNTHPATINVINGEHYTRYLGAQTANTFMKQGIQNGVFNNLGHLYETHGMGDGRSLYCPSFPDNSPLAAINYSHPLFLSTDTSGIARSTVLFNPRTKDAWAAATDNDRAFPKTSSQWANAPSAPPPAPWSSAPLPTVTRRHCPVWDRLSGDRSGNRHWRHQLLHHSVRPVLPTIPQGV